MQTAMSKRTNGFLQSRLLNQASYIARARQMFDFGQQKPDLSSRCSSSSTDIQRPSSSSAALQESKQQCLALHELRGDEKEGLCMSFEEEAKSNIRRPHNPTAKISFIDVILESLGGEAGKFFSEDSSPIVELAKWGFAMIVRILEDTQGMQSFCPSTVPPHIRAIIGEVQQYFNLKQTSVNWLSLPSLSALRAFVGSSFENTPIDSDPIAIQLGMDSYGSEYYMAKTHPSHDSHLRSGYKFVEAITERKVYENHASFPVYWKQIIPAISAAIKSGQPHVHQPKQKLRRTQAQLAVAYEAGESGVLKCEACDPPTTLPGAMSAATAPPFPAQRMCLQLPGSCLTKSARN